MLEVKKKVVSEYYKLVKALNVGKKFDYSHIIDMINFIELNDDSEFIAKHFLSK